MYTRRKLHKFVHYYSESDKEYYGSTVKDTFWEELCQGKLELPSGDLYSSIKTVKRKCNSFSLNEANFWWNQVLDSPSEDNHHSCDDDTSSKKACKRKKRKNYCADKDRQMNLDIMEQIKEETSSLGKDPNKKIKQRKLEVGDSKMLQKEGEDGKQKVIRCQREIDDGVVFSAPETVRQAITSTSEATEVLQKTCTSHLQTISPPTASSPTGHSLSDQNDTLSKQLKSPSIKAIQRPDTVSSAGVERFLTTVKEIFSNCSFQTRRCSRNSQNDNQKIQKHSPGDRQLFNNLASIINFDESIRSNHISTGPFSAVSSTSSSEWEHSKDLSGFTYPTRCKVENDKYSYRDPSGEHFKTGCNVKEPIKISTGTGIPLILPDCYVKLEKLDIPKALTEGERFKYNLTGDNIETSAFTASNLINVCPVDVTCPIGNYGSKKSDLKVDLTCSGEDNSKIFNNNPQSQNLQTDPVHARKTISENVLERSPRHSASDSLLIVHSQGNPRIFDDIKIQEENNISSKHVYNRRRALKRRIIGHILDAPSFNMVPYNKKRARLVRQKNLMPKKKKVKRMNKQSNLNNLSVLDNFNPLVASTLTNTDMDLDDIEFGKMIDLAECCGDETLHDVISFKSIESSEINQSEFQPPEANLNYENKNNHLVQEVYPKLSTHYEPTLVLENISPACTDDPIETFYSETCNLDIISHVEVVEVNVSIENNNPDDKHKLSHGMLDENKKENPRNSTSTIDFYESNDVPNQNEVDSVPQLSVNTENLSISSDPSSIDVNGPAEVLANSTSTDTNNEASFNDNRQPCNDCKKRGSNLSDPRLGLKEIQTTTSSLIVRTKNTFGLSEGQLLEHCRQRLHKLIAEGVLEEACNEGQLSVDDNPSSPPEKENVNDDQKESPDVIKRKTGGAEEILPPKIPETLELSNSNKTSHSTSFDIDKVAPEYSAGKELPTEGNPNAKVSESNIVQPSPRLTVVSSKPQDPRRRFMEHMAATREMNSTKDDQKDQCSWVESLEGRCVPNFSSVSLWPHQLEVIPASPAVDNLDNAAINQAVTKSDLRVMEKVVALLPSHLNWDLEQSDENGDTLLMIATRNDDSQMIMILKNRVNLNHKNRQRRTPLMVAAHCGKLRSVATLLELGAHIDSRDSKGKTALLLAIESNQDHVVHLLLSRGANFCPLTLTSNNFRDTGEQERASRINTCLNSHISWVTKHFDSTIFKWSGTLGFDELRALTAVQFMTPCQFQKLEFTFSYQPNDKFSAKHDRKIVLFGAHCVVQYNWFDGVVPMPADLVGGVRCNGARMASLEDTAFVLTNVRKGFNVVSIGIRPDLHPEPKAGAFVRDKLAFRAYELSMPSHAESMFIRKERL